MNSKGAVVKDKPKACIDFGAPMVEATYSGSIAHLVGEYAFVIDDGEFVYAQFHNPSMTLKGSMECNGRRPSTLPRDALGFGLHRFPRSDFLITW